MKKIIAVGVVLVVLIISMLLFYFTREKLVTIKISDEWISNYQEKLGNIKNNMDYVSIDNDNNYSVNWNSYKLDLGADQNKVYELIIGKIKWCYLMANNDANDVDNSFSIMTFNNKRQDFNKIKELYNLNNSCLKDFNSYKEFFDVENDDLKDLEIVLTPIFLFNGQPTDFRNYQELLDYEYHKISLISNVSDFLKYKYDMNK